MKYFFKRYKFFILAFLLLLVCVPLVVFALDTGSTGYKITASTASNIIYPTGYSAQCITNADSAHSYFVPTKTAAEFAAFKSHAPSGITFCLFCGDEICNNGETCSTCSGDCGSCVICGDGICSGTETAVSCKIDCGVAVDCSLYVRQTTCQAEGCIWDSLSGTCSDGSVMLQ